ncbi:MAG TPA: polymer-forming cytoskeletal protein [Gemmatimonadales bacterium]|jgi:cytoskeletal protein CcmA (bactofilin family)|nr:polymer-forming cytoskeletal protein [Gemmatimonadales bacterium]
MAIWKEQSPVKKEPVLSPEPAPRKESEPRADFAPSYDLPRRTTEREIKESLIAADLTIEGKIEGAGHIRIAGRFKGDVHVQGNLTIEAGAKLTGGVRASTVVIGGEVEGNIEDAARVELLETGVLNGDLKAGSLTVAAGSRMRGQVEFGWEEKRPQQSGIRMESGSAA